MNEINVNALGGWREERGWVGVEWVAIVCRMIVNEIKRTQCLNGI